MKRPVKLLSFGFALALLIASTASADLCSVGRKTKVLWKGDWYDATITEAASTKCKITYIGFTNDDDEWVGPERLKIKVLWDGKWYPARVIKKTGDDYLISYDGYKAEDNETVSISRIQVR